jgi:gamma-glutamyl:cysteine ligase YbdK (ATP-grasp superfamily)
VPQTHDTITKSDRESNSLLVSTDDNYWEATRIGTQGHDTRQFRDDWKTVHGDLDAQFHEVSFPALAWGRHPFLSWS